MLPAIPPTSEKKIDRRLAPCLAAPAAPAKNSITSPIVASPARMPTVIQPMPRPAVSGASQAKIAAIPSRIQFPGKLNRFVSQQIPPPQISSTARV
jgi:hypothetical protein